MKNILVIILFMCHFNTASGQQDSTCTGCCCGNDPSPAGVMISHVHPAKEWMLSYRYMSMQMGRLISGTNTISERKVHSTYLMTPGDMRMDMHMIMAMYGLSRHVTAMAMFSYRYAAMQMNMYAQSGHNHGGSGSGRADIMTSSGLGDTEFQILYAPFKNETRQFLLSAGASIPTGNIKEKGNEDDMGYENSPLPYSMQNGTGSYHMLSSLTYVHQMMNIAWSIQGSLNIPLQKNSSGYSYGNKYLANAWLSYAWLPWMSNSIRGEYIYTGEMSGYDKNLFIYNEPSANCKNYGGHTGMIYAGAVVSFKKGLLKNTSLRAEYGMPFYENYNGIQQHLDKAVNAAWTFTF